MNTRPPESRLLEFRPLIVGRGRLARHLLHLFALRGFSTLHFADARALSAEPESSVPVFRELAARATHAWLLVSDQALPPLRERVRELAPRLPVLHSSAATRVPDAATLHPLMTFSTALYAREEYDRIPWTVFDDEPAAPRLFERTQTVRGGERARYHAACVMLASFSQLLWDAGESLVPSLPREAWTPILEQSVRNFEAQGRDALTGPLVRGDARTIDAHRAALAGTAALPLYENFVRHYQEGSR